MMNMYYPHCPFPSRKWRVAKDYENLRESAWPTSAQGVNFHHSFPINFSIAHGQSTLSAALK
jgi:hypothetical protein